MKLGITSKLTISFALAIFPFFIVTGFGHYSLVSVTQETRKYTRHFEVLTLINNLTIEINLSIHPVYRYAATMDRNEEDVYRQHFQKIIGLFKTMKTIDIGHKDVEEDYEELEKNLHEFNRINMEILALPGDQIQRRYYSLNRDLRDLIQNIMITMDMLQNATSIEMKQLQSGAEDAQTGIYNILMISWAGSILFSVFISFLISKYFSKSIEAVDRAAKKIGAGDLHERIRVTSNDELGELIKTFNNMAEKLQKTTVSKDYFDNIIQTMNDALIVFTLDGTIQSVNQAACLLLEYDKEEMVNSKIDIISMDEEFFWGRDLKNLIKKGEIIHNEGVLLSKNGRRIPVLYSITEMFGEHENVEGFVCVIQDITYRKKAEEEIRYLTHQMLQIQEEERGSISRDIHDNLGGSLQALKILVHSLFNQSIGMESRKNDYTEMMNYLDEIINISRKISRSLSPVGFKSIGLPRAVTELANTLNRTKKVMIKIDVDQMGDFFPDNWDVNIYRIIQEALTNILKHSEAAMVSIAARSYKNKLSIRIKDNGKGMNLHNLSAIESGNPGLGLLIMRERAELLQGRFEISSKEGRGTVIKIEIPRK